MDIVDHKLINTPDDGVELEYRRGKASIYPFTPKVAVIHYGVTDTLDALWRAQNYRGFFAHVSIDGWSEHADTGPVLGVSKVIQSLDFNERGSHCGKSFWNGVNGVSAVGFGIEISNPGPLIEKNGELFTVYGKTWPREQSIQAYHKHGMNRSWKHWAVYTDEEIGLCVQLCALWRHHYGIVDIVGHDEIAKPLGRKSDPGPAFPIETVRKAVFPEMFADTERAPAP